MMARMKRGSEARPGGEDSGFTLAEILVATVILLLVALGVIGALTFSARTTAVTAQRTRALNMASQYVERARNLDYDLVGTYLDGGVYGDPPGSIHTPDTPTTMWDSSRPAPTFGTGITVATKVTWQRNSSGRSQYKNIEVIASWTNPIPGSVKLATSVFGKTSLTNVGDLQVSLKDKSTDAPIAGVAVSITPKGAAAPRTVVTDAQGVAFWGMVPTGAASMTVSAADWVFDTSDPSSVPAITVATGDVLSSFTVLGQKASNLRVRAVGTHGEGLSGVAISTTVTGKAVSAVSDAQGYVLFTAVPPGVYSVTGTRSDRQQATGSVTVPAPAAAGQVFNASLTMHDPISVTYRVNAANTTSPESGAVVTLYTQAGAAVSSGNTNGSGLVTLSALAPGNYYAMVTVGAAQGRHPAVAGAYLALSATDYGNHDSPVGASAGGLLIQLSAPSLIRVGVIGTGGGAFPHAASITVDGVSHNAVNGSWDFAVTQVRAYSVQVTSTGYRPFGTGVAVTGYGQVFPVTALLDSMSAMTVEVRGKWGQALLTNSTVAVVGPKPDSVSASGGYAYFTAAQGHALYGTNQQGDSPYTITARRSGYHDGVLSGVALVPGQMLVPNPVLYLTPARSGTFVITTRKNSNNTIHANASIQVIGPTNSPDSIGSSTVDFTTDSNGSLTIADLPLGTYTFRYKQGSSYRSVSTPSSKALTADGQTQTFDVKW